MAKIKKPGLKDLTFRLKSIKAKDIMTRRVITTTEDTSLAEIAQLMIKSRISGLPVVKKGKIVGVIIDRDLFIVMDMIKFGEVVKEQMQTIFNPIVKFAMSTDVVKIKENTSLEEIIT
ncbi:MAG: CBS domain-containing protein, partial [Candidatus Omnitrophica bacterium]|nr:CBS domain-containing protein [Candidatus Omnitrophota bacterium]